MDKQSEIIHANFFFVDGIGLSDPTMSTKTQLKKIEALHNCVRSCPSYSNTSQDQILKIPTGDGMCLGFLQGIDKPIKLAIELQKELAVYNKGKIPSEIIQIRTGIHSGNCFIFSDIDGNQNVWGPGIIIAKRIMDIGDASHILLSRRIAEDLKELSDEYNSFIRPIGDYELKHNIPMLVYSAIGDDFGNKTIPEKGKIQQSKLNEEAIKIQNTTMYDKVHVSLSILDAKTMMIHHKRTYYIKNLTNEPIRYILHGIATDIPKVSFNELNFKTYDDSGKEMKISSINLDTKYCKEFSTVFNSPVLKDQNNRSYTLEYKVEEPERFYENAFQVDCKEFVLEFIFENSDLVTPKLFEVNQETDEKIKSNVAPNIQKNENKTKMTWILNNMVKGRTIRLEW